MPIGRTTGTSFTDRSVEPGSTVDYYVRAVDNLGNLSDLLPRQSVTIPSLGTGTFAPPISASINGVGIGVADVNGDGSRDLVVSGGGVATALGPLTPGLSFTTSPVSFGMIPNDDLPFFHIANIIGDSRSELLGNFDLLVWNAANNLWEVGPGTIQQCNCDVGAYIDINDDGILDIVGVTFDSPSRLIGILGTGNGSYDNSSTRELAGIKNFAWDRLRHGPIVAADVDRDGLTDLIVWDGATFRVVRQTQRGTFSVTASLPAIDSLGFRNALLVADVTGDGYPDIIYAHYASAPDELRVYVNDGAGGFSTTAVSSGISAPWNFSAADIDGDGIQDLVVGNRVTTNLDLYISQGDGTFTFSSSINGVGIPFITLADIDLDGDMDIVTTGSTDVRIYLNQ